MNVSDIWRTITDIDWTDRLRVIKDKLDDVYLHDQHAMAYTSFKGFYSYKKTAKSKNM